VHPTSRRSLALLAAGAAAIAGVVGGVNASAAPSTSSKNPNSDATVTTGLDSTSAVVGLSLAPLATDAKLAPAKGKKVDFNSSAAKSERAKLVAQRNTFKQWLKSNAPKAQVTGEYDVAVNAVAVRLNGTALATLRNGPGVTSVGYQATYAPTADDPDLSLVNGKQGWAAATPTTADETAGRGIKVGIVDSGIDVNHPCFDDAGFPGTQQQGNPAYTNNKVIIAKVFANKAAKLGYDAKAVGEHGTHVAGTVACDANTPASIDGAKIPYAPSGVAPGAQLGSYNVFPGDIEDARSEDILNALDAAALDDMDVINMSLGGDSKGVQDLLMNAVNNLDQAGVVVAVSAGNEGPGHGTIGSPGAAERALTAGASSVGHYLSTPVTIGGTSFASNSDGDFPVKADVSGGLVKSTLSTGETSPNGTLGIGCVADDIPVAAKDGVVLVSRGTCSFAQKVANAAAKNAKAVIVVNSTAGDPIAMAGDPTLASLPAVMISQDDYKANAVPADGVPTTITAKKVYHDSDNDNIMGDFSSQGPTDVDYRVKPDLVAPGVNVLSSIPLEHCVHGTPDVNPDGCWAFFNGTSMASPHLAGTAAVVLAAHPDWSAGQVRSAITNTAQQGVLFNYKSIRTPETDPLVTGAGLLDVPAAVNAKVALSSVSTSFGAVPAGSGQTVTKSLTLTNLTDGPVAGDLSIVGPDRSLFAVSSPTVSLPTKGATQTVSITFTSPKAGATGDRSATLKIGGIAHSVLYAFLK
jgi:minor extracellular serine protease Vpr